MKRKNTLVERNIRKGALKMTVIFMVLCVAIEAVIFALISFVTKSIGGLAFDKISVCIGIICFDIVLAIVGYFDFKKIVIEQENNKENKMTE